MSKQQVLRFGDETDLAELWDEFPRHFRRDAIEQYARSIARAARVAPPQAMPPVSVVLPTTELQHDSSQR